MSLSAVGTNKQLNYEPAFPYPTSDPSVWTVDEDDVLNFAALYGSLGSHDGSNNYLYQPQMPSVPPANTYLPNGMQFPDIKPQFPLTTNHSLSMPVLPTNEPPCQKAPGNNTSMFSIAQLRPQIPERNFNPPELVPEDVTLHHPPLPSAPGLEMQGISSTTTEPNVVTFVDLKPFYEKGQVRLQGKSEQRLDYSTSFVRIYLENPDNIKEKVAFVERYPDAAHILKDNLGTVPLKILPGENKSWLKVNLDDAGCEVYKLSKVKGEQRNRFHIVLQLVFQNGTRRRFYSDTFQVKSKPKSADYILNDGTFEDMDQKTVSFEPDAKKKAVKRLRPDDNDVMTSSPGSVGSSVFPEVITDHLQATTATIDQLKILQPIQTHRGDIAYHFKLDKRPTDPALEEGDIIGFFETSDGGTEIKRLTCQNVHDTKLAGVVSRSAWLEGKMPEDIAKGNEQTDMVCVIGVVKVKVRGPVKNGERIYASLSSYPGVAMAENVITQVTSNELTLIGQSLEALEDAKPDQINLVSCFVSILLSIHTKYTAKAMKEMRSDVLVDVDKKIKKAKKKCIKGLSWKLAILFILLALVGVLLYQLYAPLTAYRYWKCKQGSTGKTSSFEFITMNKQDAKVNGVEFHFDDLLDKLDLSDDTKKITNHEDHRYYLNLDRCAAGGLRSGVYGPTFYVLNNQCTEAYYYSNNKSVYNRYNTHENIVCSHYAAEPHPSLKVTEPPPSLKLTEPPPKYSPCYSGIDTTNGNASFVYISSSTGKETFASGIRTDLDTIRAKTNESIDELSKRNVRYYFNVNRCTGDGGGPQYFAVVGACNNTYYYSKRWKKYGSAKEFKCSTQI